MPVLETLPVADSVSVPDSMRATSDRRVPFDFGRFCDRHFRLLAFAVLSLALFNLAFRIGHELVMQWDESLYAVSAWEMLKSGKWTATTFLGELDYYNTKPPLNVWLMALSFKAFGFSLVSLRLPSILAAWTTVAVVLFWMRRCLGSAVGLVSALVLSTTFGFLYVHSARNANTDALFALIFVLMMMVLWASDRRPWRAAWVGPLLAATFMLRGPAALMFLVVIGVYWVAHQEWLRGSKRVAAVALVLFLAPVVAWATARWRIDQERFFVGMFGYDLVARTARPLEGHEGSLLYYPYILVKHQYDWLLAAVVGTLVVPGWYRLIWPTLRSWRRSPLAIALTVWAVVGVVIPTLVSTKVPWYLNHSYPVFAIGVAALVAAGFDASRFSRVRTWLLAAACLVALATAEAKLWSYSYNFRDLSHVHQGLLVDHRSRIAGHQVFRAMWDRADVFVIGAIVGAERGLAAGVEDFLAQSRPGDYLMLHYPVERSELALVGSARGRNWLYRRDH
jgi:4-amino-4-deoxy-L-arabinose transferase-like glycosyltransferase